LFKIAESGDRREWNLVDGNAGVGAAAAGIAVAAAAAAEIVVGVVGSPAMADTVRTRVFSRSDRARRSVNNNRIRFP